MSNLTNLAFPFIEPSNNETGSVSIGLTKHEYAAILLTGHLAAKYEYLPTIQEGDDIATTAHFLASQVLGKFK
jgi:hypothetical protein